MARKSGPITIPLDLHVVVKLAYHPPETEWAILEAMRIPAKAVLRWTSAYSRPAQSDVLAKALKPGQLASKGWMIQAMDRLGLEGDAVVFAGWCGVTATLLHFCSNRNWRSITTVDRNPGCSAIARHVCDGLPNVHVKVYDVARVRSEGLVDVAINTSLEHFTDRDLRSWIDRLPRHVVMVLQSTDMPDPGHVAPSADLASFSRRLPPIDLLFTGSLRLASGYQRHLIIAQLRRRQPRRSK